MGATHRLAGIDRLRGLVMLLMALDHVRDFVTDVRFDPTDLAHTTPALFLTRWVTHFCAPTFVLLAGMSAWLAGRHRTRADLARFLVTRGLWLIVLEFTVVNLAWYGNLRFESGLLAQVIWAIGAAMAVLAGLVFLPRAVLAVLAVAIIAGHNAFDGVVADGTGAWSVVWRVLHVSGPLPGLPVMNVYPLLPWIGVMVAGFALGAVLEEQDAERRRVLLALGAAMTIGFLVLRAVNLYGDPQPWQPRSGTLRTALAFLDTTKYPPSCDYLLMTLGPALLALVWLERASDPPARWLAVFGQVPLFYYVAHLWAVRALATIVGTAQGFPASALAVPFFAFPAGFGVGLPAVYAAWAVVVLLMYVPSRSFAEIKRQGTAWWWSYL